MAVKLHRCNLMFFKADAHPCWRVQKALDEAGIEYELETMFPIPRGRRERVHQISGQRAFPVIEFEDGTAYRDESARMAATIREGKLFEQTHAGGGGHSTVGGSESPGGAGGGDERGGPPESG